MDPQPPAPSSPSTPEAPSDTDSARARLAAQRRLACELLEARLRDRVQTPRGEPTAREAPTTAGSAVLAGAPSALSLARLVEELASTGARPSEAARLLSWAAEALHSVAPDVAPRAEAPALPRVEGPGAPADLRIFDEALRTVGDLLEALESERQVRRRAQLSYLVHELKNPLNTIVNALWLLRERGAITDPNRRFLELAERGAERLEVRLQGLRQLE